MTDKTGLYTVHYCPRETNTNQFCPRQKKGDIPTMFVHNRQTRVIYQPFLFMIYNTGRYANKYCPRQTKQGDIPTINVHDRQNRLIYQPILSKLDTTVKYTNQYCPRKTKPGDIAIIIVHGNGRQKRVIYQPILSTADKTAIYTNRYCPQQTKPGDIQTIICPKKLVDISTNIVGNKRKWKIYQPILSMTD